VALSRSSLLAFSLLFSGCGAAPTLAARHIEAAPAVTALREGSFDDSMKQAGRVIEKDAQNPEALMVRAISRYRATMTQVALDGRTIVIGAFDGGNLNQRYLRSTAEQAEADLAAIEDDLAKVAESPDVSLELCLACYENVDWTGDGRVNHRDELLLQIEVDERGEPLPEDDPRRTPTFRFDHGDVAWARAFIGFERAALDVILAYDYTALGDALADHRREPTRIYLKLVDRGRIGAAKSRLLEALGQSEAARQAYLRETDDDREWVPNPRQKSHPMPLPVDQALYDTWGGVLGDLQKIVRGEEGIAVADVAKLLQGEVRVTGARGYVDIGAMLENPRDITIEVRDLEALEDEPVNAGALLKSMLGEYYVDEMKPSPLPKRLARMKGEIDAHQEDIEHKLRYLFWLN